MKIENQTKLDEMMRGVLSIADNLFAVVNQRELVALDSYNSGAFFVVSSVFVPNDDYATIDNFDAQYLSKQKRSNVGVYTTRQEAMSDFVLRLEAAKN